MRTEKAKMLAGELYDPRDVELQRERRLARLLIKAFNDSCDDQWRERKRLLLELFDTMGKGTFIEPPFYCDYGGNISLGERVFFNFNCVILDVAQVTIGNHVLFGPGVQVYTATHPLDAEQRRSGLEAAKPITIGDDVWIGGGAILSPGVTIGARSVIGAGSVVTKDIPADVFAGGNPCRVIRSLESGESH
ncbi:sugar O-acetyltransferase [Halomonas alkalisoli]|uniref:sugar O-acetyltransferase n=1 Tax=Halomonas alkalisoli TaxID=2907158 RepID=UPI001F2CDB91|nr:sugar O-acetyltransferase [Halomonas alkalisoli]MCE9683699.1 sugar O-acetyltransferase [Halomonas alkalisoli]